MKNPNGYGTVAKLSGNRRRPYVARKTKGWDDRGYPIYDTIGYYATREEGLIALAEYNRNPFDINASKITVKELFEKWSEKKLCKLGDSLQGSLKSAFKHCAASRNMQFLNPEILFSPLIVQREPRRPVAGVVASRMLDLFVQDDIITE